MNTLIELRPSNGGTDANNFAQTLCSMIEQALKKSNFSVELIPSASQSFTISTDASLSKIQWLEGVHVVTRIPAKSSARHTSSATVIVRPEVSRKKVSIRKSDVRVDRYRSSGSGGQNVNKVETAVRLTHYPTGIVITRETGRSQHANLEDAYRDLETRLQNLSVEKQHAEVNDMRSLESSRAFTHNFQRDEVVQHSTGKKWNLKKFHSGRISILSL